MFVNNHEQYTVYDKSHELYVSTCFFCFQGRKRFEHKMISLSPYLLFIIRIIHKTFYS